MYFEMGSFVNFVFATSAIFYSAVIILIAVCNKVVYPKYCKWQLQLIVAASASKGKIGGYVYFLG